jgi:DNA-binding transcriptional ArsR family regulator
VCELGDVLGISQPTVSQHIRRFKQLGLVKEQRQGQKVCYTLNSAMYLDLNNQFCQLLGTDISRLDAMAGEWQRWQDSQQQPCVRLCKTDSKLGE